MTNEMKSKIIYETCKQNGGGIFRLRFVLLKSETMNACFDTLLQESSGLV